MDRLRTGLLVGVLLVCAVPVSPSCVHLEWIATGDDGVVGCASGYDLRYSEDSVVLANHFDEATQVQGLPTPQPAGSDESFTVPGLVAGTKYFFALRVADEASNWSDILDIGGRVASEESCSAPEACLHIEIDEVLNCIQGQHTSVDVLLSTSTESVGGFDLLVAYDQTALLLTNVEAGALLTDCRWEYFSYSLISSGSCSGCPTGQVRIMAIAELFNGPFHPSCYLESQLGTIAILDFLVSNDYTLECQFVPVNFFWMDCGDNGVSSEDGNTLWVSREVYNSYDNNITNPSHGFPGFYGVPNQCLEYSSGKPTAIRCADFSSGGISTVCVDSIDGRGDINLNDIPYEIADAVVFTNYFIRGLAAFTINVDGQIAATDVTADGIPLTVADLVYLTRIITGDADPVPKVDPAAWTTATVEHRDGVVTVVDASADIGAVHLIVEGEVEPVLHGGITGMELRYGHDGVNTRVLIWDPDGRSHVGLGPMMLLESDDRILSIEAASVEGIQMSVDVRGIPSDFTLFQNYPNPFNPVTEISFDLPQSSRVTLDVYDIIGRKVTTLVDDYLQAGGHSVSWGGRSSTGETVASGVYFYRLQADRLSQTRKMLLLK
ncbi:MAG: hypothetical protein DRP45_11045 [Candidatus Zixiibacteriota bacterium]|nr:MAG: hypothetical protein DRP45_11045 [candidate division Zixibacteria bacterium]